MTDSSERDSEQPVPKKAPAPQSTGKPAEEKHAPSGPANGEDGAGKGGSAGKRRRKRGKGKPARQPHAPAKGGESGRHHASHDTTVTLKPGHDHAICVRYGKMRFYEYFQAESGDFEHDDIVVIQTRRGIELGVVRQPVSTVDEVGSDAIKGTLIRLADEQDRVRWTELLSRDLTETAQFARERIAERDLPMKLVDVEIIFGADKLVFYFVADGWVDFRELVRDLARKFRTRIELLQIGARDEAKLTGDVSTCGRSLCCGSYLWSFEQISMKMAKNQRTTLDPTKISGMCGRLKCCLLYEDSQYAEMKGTLPRTGCHAKCKHAVEPFAAGQPVRVLNQNILMQTVLVTDKENERRAWLDTDALDWPRLENLRDNDDLSLGRKGGRRKKGN